MPIETRVVTSSNSGINSFDLDQHQGTYVNQNTEGTFVNFLSSSTRYIEQIALNYSALRDGTKEGALAYVENSQGTAWLPYTVGGTYYPKGWYIWDGMEWIASKSNVAEALDAASGTGSIVQGDNVSLLTNDAGYTTFDGDYNSLTNKPTLFDGDYNSLSNKPTLFDGDYNSLTNTPSLFSGSYDDLTDKPEETELDLEQFYSELTYTSGSLTKVEYYNSAAKTTKYYTKDLTYTSGALTQVVLTDNVNTVTVWTKSLTYDVNGNLTNLTKS